MHALRLSYRLFRGIARITTVGEAYEGHRRISLRPGGHGLRPRKGPGRLWGEQLAMQPTTAIPGGRSPLWRVLGPIIGLALITAVAYFFYRELSGNWNEFLEY